VAGVTLTGVRSISPRMSPNRAPAWAARKNYTASRRLFVKSQVLAGDSTSMAPSDVLRDPHGTHPLLVF